MKINFKSTIKNDDDEQVIEFVAPVVISEMNEFTVYEFVEPQNNVINRIEVSNMKANIFAGPSTIMLVLNELIRNEYFTQAGTVIFDSELNELVIEDGKVDMQYSLGTINNKFGEFRIQLSISE